MAELNGAFGAVRVSNYYLYMAFLSILKENQVEESQPADQGTNIMFN